MNTQMLRYGIGLSLVITIIVLDQITKWAVLELIFSPLDTPDASSIGLLSWIMHAPERTGPIRVEIWPFFNLTMVWNQGVSFGMFQSGNPIPLIILSLVISGFFLIWMFRTHYWIQLIPIAMVIGGALGNVVDRFRFGAVADFLDFHAFGYHYPAFNLADSCITLGVVFLIFDGMILEPKRKAPVKTV